MKKIAISLPDYQAAAIERIRRKSRTPRSRVVQRAIDRYLAQEGLFDEIRRYEAGYRRTPERAEMAAYSRVAVSVLTSEKWE